ALSIKEIPIEPEAVQLELLQPEDIENIEDTQDPWKSFEENVVASDKGELDSDEESLYPIISRNKEPSTYYIKDLFDARLDQIQQLLKLRVN
ncbi:34310_t:CDS:2, partial [Gigaspora margarita]